NTRHSTCCSGLGATVTTRSARSPGSSKASGGGGLETETPIFTRGLHSSDTTHICVLSTTHRTVGFLSHPPAHVTPRCSYRGSNTGPLRSEKPRIFPMARPLHRAGGHSANGCSPRRQVAGGEA